MFTEKSFEFALPSVFHWFEVKKIPLIYCEATELVKLPPVAVDPVSELVSSNNVCLKDIEGKVSQLQDQLANLQVLTAKVESCISTPLSTPVSFADAVKSPATLDSGTTGSVSGDLKVIVPNRVDNLIIFGLPEVESLHDLKSSVDELLNFLLESLYLSGTCTAWVVVRKFQHPQVLPFRGLSS